MTLHTEMDQTQNITNMNNTNNNMNNTTNTNSNDNLNNDINNINNNIKLIRKEDDKINVTKLWSDFQLLAQNNLCLSDSDLIAPTENFYPPLPCGTTSLPPMQNLIQDPMITNSNQLNRLSTSQERERDRERDRDRSSLSTTNSIKGKNFKHQICLPCVKIC